MNFKDYLSAVETVFNFRIKALFPLEDAAMDLLEKALQKYRPAGVSKPTKTMFQTNPLGFTGAKCVEVYICDVELTVPVSSTLLQYDLRSMLGLHKDDESLKVFSEHEMNLAQEVEPMEEGEEPSALLTNDHYEEVEEANFSEYFGDAYNAKFKEYLKTVEGDRAKKKGRGAEVDAKHPITKWADQPARKPDSSDTEQPR